MIKWVTHTHLGPIWYNSEPSDFPYSPNQFLALNFFCRFLQPDCSRTESLFSVFFIFTSFLVKDSSSIFNREDVIGLWNKSWYLCCITSVIVVPPLLSFFKGVIILSIRPEVPSSKYLPSLIPEINIIPFTLQGFYSELKKSFIPPFKLHVKY